jgi:hypothetical protein
VGYASSFFFLLQCGNPVAETFRERGDEMRCSRLLSVCSERQVRVVAGCEIGREYEDDEVRTGAKTRLGAGLRGLASSGGGLLLPQLARASIVLSR